MKNVTLGKSGINVSKICFGALTIGPLQKAMSLDEGAEVIAYALKRGVNFVDTAQLYETYPYIERAIKKTGVKPVIASKTYAFSAEDAKRSLEEARKALNVDYVDIFLLHEQESEHTIRGHSEAMEYFLEAREKGYIKAFGISTHHISAVKAAMMYDEIEIIHPIINSAGRGICDGTIDEMLSQVRLAHRMGKGIYSMKPLGGGNLLGNYMEAMNFVKNLDCVDAVAVGMQSLKEVDMNISFFEGLDIDDKSLEEIKKVKKLNIEWWCEGCGKCVKRCKQGALKIDEVNNSKVLVDSEKCVLCGYCSAACDVFAIKVY